jgi:hypothetical protein
LPYAANQIPGGGSQSGRRADFTAHDAAELLQTIPFYRGRSPTPTAQAIQNTGYLLNIARNDRENEGLWTRPACYDWPRLRNGTITLGRAFTSPNQLQSGDVAVIPLPNLHFAYYEGKDRYGNDIFSQIDGTSSPVQIVTREYLQNRAAAQGSRVTYRKPGT